MSQTILITGHLIHYKTHIKWHNLPDSHKGEKQC